MRIYFEGAARMKFALLPASISMVLLLSACSNSPESVPTSEGHVDLTATDLRVLVVDDMALADAVQRQWQARSEGTVNVVTATSAELRQAKRLGADVVLYAPALLGSLAEQQLISKLPDEFVSSEHYRARDIFELPRGQETHWSGEVYAVPLGSPQFMLLYRADILSQLELAPPQTWSEYQQLVVALAEHARQSESGELASEGWRPTLESVAPGWAGKLLLARAAAYSKHRSHYSTVFNFNTMEPLIDGPPFIRALEELQTAVQAGDVEVRVLTPAAIFAEFVTGHSALAITWLGPAMSVEEGVTPIDSEQIGVALLPGSTDVYNGRTLAWEIRGKDESIRVATLSISGRVGSISRETSQREAAANMLTWIAGPELSTEISTASPATTLFRTSQLATISAWLPRGIRGRAAEEFASVVQQSQNGFTAIHALRIPGRSEYLASLDDAVRQVVMEEMPPAEALSEAAAEWRAITEKRGQESQGVAYRKSLGLE